MTKFFINTNIKKLIELNKNIKSKIVIFPEEFRLT